MRMKNSNGFSVIELAIAGFLTAVVVYLAASQLSSGLRTMNLRQEEMEAQKDAAFLGGLILKLGRTAQSCDRPCTRTVPAGETCELQCRMNGKEVSFLANAAEKLVAYDEFPTGGAAWNRIRTFGKPVASIRLVVCGSVEHAGGCSLTDGIEAGTADIPAVLKPRFFHFSVIFAPNGVGSIEHSLQSSFYVRNPLPAIFNSPGTTNGSLKVIETNQ